MDPASAVTGFIGLSALAGQAALSVKDLVDTFKAAPREIEELAGRLLNMRAVMEDIKAQYHSASYPEQPLQRTLQSTVVSCERCICELNMTLERINSMSDSSSARKLWKSVKATSTLKHIRSVNERLSVYQDDLITVLVNCQRNDMETVLDHTSRLQSMITTSDGDRNAQLHNIKACIQADFERLRIDMASHAASVERLILQQSSSIFQPTTPSPPTDKEHFRHGISDGIVNILTRSGTQAGTSESRQTSSGFMSDKMTPKSRSADTGLRSASSVVYDISSCVRSYFGTIVVRYTISQTTISRDVEEYTDINRQITVCLVGFPAFNGHLVCGRLCCRYQQYMNPALYLSLRSCAIVSFRCPVFRAARDGDLHKMKLLFQEGFAHPTDVESLGCNLFLTAAFLGHDSVCRYLTRLGLDPLHNSDNHFAHGLPDALRFVCAGGNLAAIDEFLAHTDTEGAVSQFFSSYETSSLRHPFLNLFLQYAPPVPSPFLGPKQCIPLLDLFLKHGICSKDLILSRRLPNKEHVVF